MVCVKLQLYEVVQQKNKIQGGSYEKSNEIIISVGYRAKSIRGTQFRIWENVSLIYWEYKKYFIKQIELANKYNLPIIIHSRESQEDVEKILREILQDTVRITPIDKIVIETDSPVLPLEPFEKHSRKNSLYLKYIINKIAEIKGLSEDDVIKNTMQNAYKVYGIKKS